ncbi:MAG: hypothetical protein JSR36_10420 [Proteobacteria bacterium]|nr:hypothetical protein [Pseudomonadota bacterium]
MCTIFDGLKLAAAIAFFASGAALADPVAFDLAGPTLDVEVTRGAVTLPISQVPELATGDRVWLKAALSDGEAVHYLMVVAFLRGSTAPPPASWFSRCDTWTGSCSKEGVRLTVPPEAREVLVFLAPQTGGDFKTLVNAVRGRPGVFVRTSQDLNQAAAEHLRLQSYLKEIRRLGDSDPVRLKEAAPLLSRSLAIRVDAQCLEKPPTLQAACLMQGRNALIMADGAGESVTQVLTSGPASDLAMEAGNTPQLKSGYYGPFIGSLLDIARLFDSFHTAKYQYIPALAVPRGRELALTLNAPPSFHDPKSVLVAALPAVEDPQFPELHAVDAQQVYCIRKEPLVLAIEGAPLMFAGSFAHHLTLRVPGPGATHIDLPATPDPAQGGLVIDTSALSNVVLGERVRGSLQGSWGFASYSGPGFNFVDTRAQSWTLAPGEEEALVVGREDTVHLVSGSPHCVSDLKLANSDGRELKVDWKLTKTEQVEARLPLENASAGAVTLLISQYGSAQPQRLTLHTYAEAGHLDAFVVHSGDDRGVLRGSRLDEVAGLVLNGIDFRPETLSSIQGKDELMLVAREAPGTALILKSGDGAKARVTLKDGRTLNVRATLEEARPRVTLIGKSLALSLPASIRLGDSDELPQDAQLTFALHAQSPSSFTRDDSIEVATLDDATATQLTLSNGSLTLQDAKIAVARLDPAKAFGPSTFGPLRFRIVSHGVAGDWQQLAKLVRLPQLQALSCPESGDQPCQLSGTNLFLLESVSADAHFGAWAAVPDGFTGSILPVPRPEKGELYVKLRDDPGVVSVAAIEAPLVHPGPEGRQVGSGRKDPQVNPVALGSGSTAPAEQPGAAVASGVPAGATGINPAPAIIAAPAPENPSPPEPRKTPPSPAVGPGNSARST